MGLLSGLFCRDLDFTLYMARASHIICFGLNQRLLFFGTHRPPQYYVPVLGDDLNVLCVSGETFVLDYRSTNLAGYFDVGAVVFLLIGGSACAVVTFVDSGVVGWRGRLLPGSLGRESPTQSKQANQYDVAESVHLCNLLSMTNQCSAQTL